MFRLEISHLQALTILSLPDALPNLWSHSVYSCGICAGYSFWKSLSLQRVATDCV